MEFQLNWIDESVLIEIVKKRFARPKKKPLNTDPTLNITRRVLMNMSEEEISQIEDMVSWTKTIQNRIGLFHQDVLGSAPGWENSGSTGGVIDLQSSATVPLVGDRIVVAELKMRYNTIKASDEHVVWDQLKDAVNVIGQKHTVGYLFQLVPKNRASYDREWKVSGRPTVKYVRCADGVTAYHIVTKDPNALYDLLQHLPYIFIKAFPELQLEVDDSRFEKIQDFVKRCFMNALPEKSALL